MNEFGNEAEGEGSSSQNQYYEDECIQTQREDHDDYEPEYFDREALDLIDLRDANIDEILMQIEQLKEDLEKANYEIEKRENEKQSLNEEFGRIKDHIDHLEKPKTNEEIKEKQNIEGLFQEFNHNVKGLKKKNLSSLNHIQQLDNTIEQSRHKESMLDKKLK